jgi:hypothetical protein
MARIHFSPFAGGQRIAGTARPALFGVACSALVNEKFGHDEGWAKRRQQSGGSVNSERMSRV